MKTNSLLVAALLTGFAFPAHAQEPDQQPDRDKGWEYALGAGAIYTPNYRGDDHYRLSLLPDISVRYKESFSASIFEGIAYKVVNTDDWRVGPIIKYDFGRDEDNDNLFALGDETDDLQGLGDVDGTFEVGGFVEYSFARFTAKIEARQAIDGHDGLLAEMELKFSGKLPASERPAFYSIGPEITYADASYNGAFFDVSASQSAASGLAQFEADSGFNSYGLHGNLFVPLNSRVALIAFGGFDRLDGDVADSPLVQQRGSEDQWVAGIVLSYTL